MFLTVLVSFISVLAAILIDINYVSAVCFTQRSGSILLCLGVFLPLINFTIREKTGLYPSLRKAYNPNERSKTLSVIEEYLVNNKGIVFIIISIMGTILSGFGDIIFQSIGICSVSEKVDQVLTIPLTSELL